MTAAASLADSGQPLTDCITAPSLELGHARATAVGSAETYIESQRRNDNITGNAVDDHTRSQQQRVDCCSYTRTSPQTDRQTISFIEISIEAGILPGGKHEACFVLGVAGIEPMPS